MKFSFASFASFAVQDSVAVDNTLPHLWAGLLGPGTLYSNTRKELHKHRTGHRGQEAQTDTQRRQQERQDKTEGDERIQTEHQTAQQNYRALVTRVPMRKYREYARDDWKHRKKTAQTRPEI